MKIQATTADAYKLVHDGVLALARAERQGIRIDTEYCEKKMKHLERKIDFYERKLQKTKFYRRWKHIYGAKTNIHSNHQLAKILYKVMKINPTKITESGQGATDEDALEQIDLPELKTILKIRKLSKIKDTYLKGFMREETDGYIHPVFNLHIARTYRSCVAEGTKVLAVRDFVEYPDGIPIERIKAGDFVYCFDDELEPAIRKVLWAGKTGHKEVVRVHWTTNSGRRKGHLDVTPEHLIRLIDGTYQPAEKLDPEFYDYRNEEESRRLPRVRTLSCCRSGDSLRFTGHLKHGNGIHEHRLIYEHFYGELNPDEIIHHKNGNHLDHTLGNLEKMTLSAHSRHHSLTRPAEVTKKCIQALHDNRHKIQPKSGWDNPNSLRLSKSRCIRELAKVAGQVAKVPYDFETFKDYLKKYEIDPWEVRRRYDRNGNYITRKMLKSLQQPIKIGEISRGFGLNYKKAKQMLEERGFGYKKTEETRNPYGRRGLPGNHIITKVEWLGETVDVYDIEVEECHNFFANEICVHNSSSDPNFQNIPKRDKEALKICRRALFPRPGHMLVEADFSALEVMISVMYHKDPTMLKYLKDKNSDMHLDMAKQIFKFDSMDKSLPEHGLLRTAAKNGFVFPQFYGDYYASNAKALADWAKLPHSRWKPGTGVKLPDGKNISDHLIKHGVKSFDRFTDYMKEVENDFWGNRFRVYNEWRNAWVEKYRKRGYLKMLTGFTCSGVMRRNEIINYPIQGTAFHCLLLTFIKLDEVMRKEKWDSRLIGQIHDSIIMDVHPDELSHIEKTAHKIVREDLPNAWPWIIIPLEIEIDVYGVDQPWIEAA